MEIYFIYLIIAGVQAFIFFSNRDKNLLFSKQNYVLVCCTELILLAGLRSRNVGADTEVYLDALNYYEKLPKLDLLGAGLVKPFDFEIGYFWLTKMLALFNVSETVFLFVIATIIYVPFFSSLNKYSKYPYLSIVVYFGIGLFAYSLGIFRQMIAISVCLIGIEDMNQGNFKKYFVTIMVASLFHFTALVMLIPYFLRKIDLKLILKVTFLLQIIFLFFGNEVVHFIFYVLPNYSNYIGGKYDVQGGSYLMLLLLNFVLIISYYIFRCDMNSVLFVKIIALASVFQCLGYSFNLFGRIVSYFSIFLVFLIPNCIFYFRTSSLKYKKVLYFITLLFFILLAFNNIYQNEYITPYSFSF